MGTFYVQNFGCRATQADGAAIERQFQEHGLEPAAGPSQAQVVVLNTCTVTAAADQDARAAIRRIHRENPGCQIVVTGCYAQRAPEEIAVLPGVAQVIGNSHKHVLANLIRSSVVGQRVLAQGSLPDKHNKGNNNFVPVSHLLSTRRVPTIDDTQQPTAIHVSDIFAHTELLAAPVFDSANERTRPNLKVQDGCDNRCSFCVIPYVRGQSRSLSVERILKEVQTLVSAGYREVVISGINLGRWGRDLTTVEPAAKSPGLEDLARAILDHTSLEKLRISSVEPMDWSDDLIDLMSRSPRIAKHAHVPMQSGSDRILRAMHRKYRPWHYEEKIHKIRTAMPAAAIGADVMVGFPGEKDEDFNETYRLIESLPFTYLHVFTYSPRPGTQALAISGKVPVRIARERNRILRDLACVKKLEFMRSFVGKPVEAITLNVFDGKFTEAITENYLKLRIAGRSQPNRWVKAMISDVQNGTLISA